MFKVAGNRFLHFSRIVFLMCHYDHSLLVDNADPSIKNKTAQSSVNRFFINFLTIGYDGSGKLC